MAHVPGSRLVVGQAMPASLEEEPDHPLLERPANRKGMSPEQ